MLSVKHSAPPFFAVLISLALVLGDEPRQPPANPIAGGTMEKNHGDAPMPEPKARKAPTAPQKPEDWSRVFTKYLNAGDLDAVMELYEPDARFVAKSGDAVVGRDRIRDALGGLIKTRTRLDSRVVQAVTVGDIATLYTDFEGTTLDPSGKTIEAKFKAIEVLRRQPDGTWKLIVGDPNGRER